MASSKLIVHHLNASRSHRILWLLEEFEVPYKIKAYQRQDRLAPKELRNIHPLGLAPIVTHGEATIAESGAIVEYIIRKFGNGRARPPASGEIDDIYFSHYAEGSLMPLVTNKSVFDIVPARAPYLLRPLAKTVMGMLLSQWINPRFQDHIAFIEKHFEKSGDWFAGGDGPTSADFMMCFGMKAIDQFFPDRVGPNSKAWLARVHARPAYKRALEKGGSEDGLPE